MRRAIIKISDATDKICRVTMVTLLMICFVMITYQVFSRYILQSAFLRDLFPTVNFVRFSFAWLEEITRFFLVWMLLLGLSSVTLKMGHARIDIIAENLPEKLKRISNLVVDVISFCFFLFVGFQTVMLTLTNKPQFSTLLGLDLDLKYYPLAVTSALCCIHLVRLFVEGLPAHKKEEVGVK